MAAVGRAQVPSTGYPVDPFHVKERTPIRPFAFQANHPVRCLAFQPEGRGVAPVFAVVIRPGREIGLDMVMTVKNSEVSHEKEFFVLGVLDGDRAASGFPACHKLR
jgi:hypothetical protein